MDRIARFFVRASLVDGIASGVRGLDCGRRVGWAGFGIDRGMAFVVGVSVGISEVRALSTDRLLRVIGGSDFWCGRWIGSRESS